LIEESTEKESMKLGSRKTPGARGEVTGYLWYNGSASYRGGEGVEETGVKAKNGGRTRKARARPQCVDPKRGELSMPRLKGQ
jgi:hypothetical protein